MSAKEAIRNFLGLGPRTRTIILGCRIHKSRRVCSLTVSKPVINGGTRSELAFDSPDDQPEKQSSLVRGLFGLTHDDTGAKLITGVKLLRKQKRGNVVQVMKDKGSHDSYWNIIVPKVRGLVNSNLAD